LTVGIKLSIIIGIQHAQDNLPDITRRLQPASHPQVEFLLCHTSADPDVEVLAGSEGHIRILRCPEGSLIPHLWRDGILAARGERVVTTTAHCIPSPSWVQALLAADLEKTAVLGGTIENDPKADAKACAIFLLRYAPFAPPETRRDVRDVAADNAVYRRPDLMCYPDLLQRGFWEPSFHSRFRGKSLRLELDPTLRVVHCNRYSARQFIGQRLAHGREFGLTRAAGRSLLQRLLLVLAVPGVFPILLMRILLAVRKKPSLRPQLAAAWFWLPVFALAWVVGETSGYLVSLGVNSSSHQHQ
jgi:hypothetical protein